MIGLLHGGVIALAVAASCPGPSPASPRGQEFVPGEVLVKFADGTPAAQPRSRGVDDPVIESYVESLSKELGIPLRSPQATSGPEMLLAIDEERIGDHLVKALEADSRVEKVERTTSEPRSILETPRQQFAVRFRSPMPRGEPETSFLEEVEKKVGAPLERVDSGSGLVMTVDMAALTLELVEKLGARPDVDYAQTNAILQPQ